ncbi:MAG TPA: hypothetical protein ENO14_00380 [Chromatiales bacterium]|nr:hypothetical protein [Chromatiales bacterium]
MSDSVKRHTVEELKAMSRRELTAHAKHFGLKFNKNHNCEERAKRILAAYADEDLRMRPDAGSPSSAATPAATPGGPRPRFEALIDGVSSSDADQETPNATPGQRGGARPGAGRPEGVTEEVAAYNRLSKQPNPMVKMAVEKLFEKWSQRAQCPEVRLTKEEAFALALPWTHAIELSPLRGSIPPWIMVALTCTWTTFAIADSKAGLAREAAQRRRLSLQDPVDATEANFEESR